MESDYELGHLVREAQIRWLKPAEVFFILQNCDEHQFTHKVPLKPLAGSLFLFNKRVLKSFRKDGHSWRKRKDQRTLAEAHERLKVGNVEAVNCYYAHGEENPNFQRRSYWRLDPVYEHIVLVHYREVVESRMEAASTSTFSGYSFSTYQPESSPVFGESLEFCNNESSPSSMEISSSQIHMNGEVSHSDINETGVEVNGSSSEDFSQALRKLKRDLSLNDEVEEEIGPFYLKNEDLCGSQDASGIPFCHETDYTVAQHYYTPESAVDTTTNSTVYSNVESQPQFEAAGHMTNHVYPSQQHDYGTTPLNGSTLFHEDVLQISPANSISSTVSTKQKFTIHEISPDWCYQSEGVKIIIIGSFLSHPLEGPWACMIGETEVPVQIIQEGVFSCHAPPHLYGTVDIYITSGNRECCSEVRKFEYRSKASIYVQSNPDTEGKSLDELLLLVKLIQIVEGGVSVSAVDSDTKAGTCQEIFTDVINSILDGTLTSSSALDWIIQELLKDKLERWLSSRSLIDHNKGCSLSKEEQGIIHIVSAMGFEWALQPILNSGVGINFRDVSGWTALHWAAKFGREKMVAALIASGASAGLVTDPNAQDPIGKTPGSIASACGHTGLAGYLSEVALTSHLSSLTLEECEVSKGLAAEEAERTVTFLSNASSSSCDDEASLKHSLAAFRNAAQAAARIQAAFRAHSFQRRQQKDDAALYGGGNADEYSILENSIPCFSAASKSAVRNSHEHQLAAVSIQKKYRGWKHRKDFIALRQKVIKIQAHVRGYSVRKKYKVCWAVGILDKAILRWRRHRSGLRGYKNNTLNENEEDEDILKEFRKQKVEAEIDKAVSRVLTMVQCPRARQQYHRILKKHLEAKLELENMEYDAVFSSHLAEISSSPGIHFIEDFPGDISSYPDQSNAPASWQNSQEQ